MSNFGANFRKAREAAGLPLEKIAAETRISTRFLTAIENEAFQQLPGGIFNRGFIRAYAEYLGLDSDQVVADYDRMSSTVQEPADVLRDTDRVPSRSSDWTLYLVAAGILVALMVAYYLVTRNSTPPRLETAAVAPATATPTPQPEDVSVPAVAETPTEAAKNAARSYCAGNFCAAGTNNNSVRQAGSARHATGSCEFRPCCGCQRDRFHLDESHNGWHDSSFGGSSAGNESALFSGALH
jgi:cytoskeletal protein RodZ